MYNAVYELLTTAPGILHTNILIPIATEFASWFMHYRSWRSIQISGGVSGIFASCDRSCQLMDVFNVRVEFKMHTDQSDAQC